MAYRVGIDIGSTATKAAVFEGEDLAYTLAIPTGYSSVEAAGQVVSILEAQGYSRADCVFVATGYGRVAVPFARKTVTEITCHGKGAAWLFGDDCNVVDIGGQDTKAIVVRRGRVVKFNMNDKCSAGTGKFLEVMANRLGLSQTELSQLAGKGRPITISSMCTVFAESEVISLIGQGAPREDICHGIIESVVSKVAPLVPKADDDAYVLTGGLCENDYVIERLAAKLGGTVTSSAQARFAGAIGAALCLLPDVEPDVLERASRAGCPGVFGAETAGVAAVGELSDIGTAAAGAVFCAGDDAAAPGAGASSQPDPNTLVVTFDTTSQSLAFESWCRAQGIEGRLAPIPSQVSAGCGYAWLAPLGVRGSLQREADAGAYAGLYELNL